MFLFLLGLVCGGVVSAVLMNAKPEKKSSDKENQKANKVIAVNNKKSVVELNIPIDVLPNIYALSVEHPSVKYKKETYESGNVYEHISIDCEIHYNLNGRKEGKRCFVFSYYDQNGNLESYSTSKVYRFTEAGMEIVHIEHYVPWASIPKRIGVSVNEAP